MDDKYAAVFLWLIKIRGTLPDDYQPPFDWMLDRALADLPHAILDKIAAALAAVAHEENPHEPPREAVASEGTLRKLDRDPGPLLRSPRPWEGVAGLEKLKAILTAKSTEEATETAFIGSEAKGWWVDAVSEASRVYDPQVVRREIYEFQRRVTGIAKSLGHRDAVAFFRWLDTKKADMRGMLEQCSGTIEDYFKKLQQEMQPIYVRPLDKRTMKDAYEKGTCGQEHVRIKLYYYAKAKGIKGLGEIEDFLLSRHEPLLRELARNK